MYPAVKALYEEKVPDPLDDKRFWDLYLKSEYFRSDKGAGVFNNSNSNSNSSNDMFTVKENQLREKRKREEAKVNRVKVGEAKRTKKLMGSDVIGVKVDEFDLAASFGGERDAGQKVSERSGAKRSLWLSWFSDSVIRLFLSFFFHWRADGLRWRVLDRP